MGTYRILLILNFSISQSNYIFIKICMNLDILSLGQDIYFCCFYENSLLYGKLIAIFKFKHKFLTFVPIVQAWYHS